jgi:hypothetical protein
MGNAVNGVIPRQFLIFVGTLLMLASTGCSDEFAESKGELTMELFVPTGSHMIASSIPAKVIFRNPSSFPVLMNTAFTVHAGDGSCYLEYWLEDPSRRVPGIISDAWGPFGRQSFRRIPAGGTFERDVDVAKEFRFDVAGRYKVGVTYTSSYNGKVKGVWTGRLSATAEVNVIR